MARGLEILSIKKRESEKLKSWIKNQHIDISAIENPWAVVVVQRCLGGDNKIVGNSESQAKIIINIAINLRSLSYHCRGIERWQL